MNLLQLVIKQMRQRALGTWLTLLSVLLGVALAIAILILRREGQSVFGQTEFGYDVIVGAKGSGLQLVVNTVYQLDRSPGTVAYTLYEELASPQYRREVRFAVPLAVADSYQNHRIIATLPKMFGFADDSTPLEGYDELGRVKSGYISNNVRADERPEGAKPTAGAMEYRPLMKYELATGRMFHAAKFEAVIGADITERTGLKIGDKFKATHGLPAPNQAPDVHPEEWTVVGILRPTQTSADRALYVPLISSYALEEHEDAMRKMYGIQQGKTLAEINRAAPPPESHDDHDHDAHKSYTINPDGTIKPILPKEAWEVSAIVIKTRGPAQAGGLMFAVNNRGEAMATNPADTMRQFFQTFFHNSSLVLLLISALVTIVAAIGILVAIYNSVTARRREIAILRALGATRNRVLVLICVEAALVGLVGGVLGLVVGHALGALGSALLNSLIGQGINWMVVDRFELLYLLGVVVLATLAGLVPALSAYRTPVADHLVAT